MPFPSSDIPDFTDRLLDNNRYRLTKQIGSGSYGVVYRALDLAAFKFIARPPIRAIKIINKKQISKSQSVYLRREFNIHNEMSEHPNVVKLYRAFEDNDYAYLVLEYCAGGDLHTKACREGLYWRNDALLKKVMIQIIDSIAACHAKNIAHRDLKPENILTNEDGSMAFLTDFGLSSNQPIANSFGCGSAPYMSPGMSSSHRPSYHILTCLAECIGEECDFMSYSNVLSDVWSLAIVFLNISCARLPWQIAMTTDNHFHKFILDPNYLRTQFPISEGFNRILCRMLELLPESRMTLTELRFAIQGLDTFWMSDEEIALSTAEVKDTADWISSRAQRRTNPAAAPANKGPVHRRGLPKLACGNKFQMQRVGSRGQMVQIDLRAGNGRFPGHNMQQMLQPHCPQPIRPIIPKRIEPRNCGSVDITSIVIPSVATTMSADDSDTPITPETFPVDPKVVVSDLEDDLGVAAISSDAHNAKPRPLRVVNQFNEMDVAS
ncbi:hypothetical protein NLI96_g921 [Meripilus lineatus]|uniref:Protein kinase domain-containing protein n=1 Tax=Meripilus lineatus TaxID=2056292 RepID=A0AAD5VBC1_9APHY|nr:hypothetical protein NLI96_g921 [Physisporinus lineatus]